MSQLSNMDIANARKARFLSRCTKLKDLDCMSKGFFKRFSSKRCRDALAKIEMDDGTIIKDNANIARECMHYFGKILSNAPKQDDISKRATTTMLQYVDSCIDQATSLRLEEPFDKNELFYALRHLGNEKPLEWMISLKNSCSPTGLTSLIWL